MSDIVNELLFRASDEDGIGWTPTTIIPVPARLLHHAADRIEQLEAEAKTRTLDYLGQVGQLSEELERLRAALQWIVGCALTEPKEMVDKARAALEGK